MTMRSRNNDMTNAETEIAQILRGLQATATLCANTFTTTRLSVEYRVAFSTGTPLPWRLLEIHARRSRNDKRFVLRRMHCFRAPEGLRRSIQERAKWKACDQQLVASYLVKIRRSSEGIIESELNQQGAASPHPSIDLDELTPARRKLRSQICVTRPERVVDLLHG